MTRKITFIAVLLSMIFLIFPPLDASSGEPKRWSKEWEDDYETRQPSERIMDAIGVKQGMVIGEVGAGNGRFAVKVAARVGESGKVFANDIDDEAISFMKKRCKREKIENMVIMEGKIDDPLFPAEALDMVYMINTFHHLAMPVELLRNIAPSLKAGGLFVIIDRDPERMKEESSHYRRKEVILEQARDAGYELIRLETFLPEDNIYIFRFSETKAAVEHVRKKQGKVVEGYPIDPGKKRIPGVFAYTGLVSAFKEAGFTECARRSPTRPIMRVYIKKASGASL